MLNFSQIEERKQTLAPLLAALKAGAIECIEYGKPGEQYMSYLRIRYGKTAGGEQFGIRRLSHGVEGSGDYTADADAALEKAMDAVLHYHRPMGGRLEAALKALRAKNGKPQADSECLSFFAVAEDSTKLGGRRRLLGEDPLATRDEVVITLTL